MSSKLNQNLSPIGRALLDVSKAAFMQPVQQLATHKEVLKKYPKIDYGEHALGVGACNYHPVFDRVN